MFGRNVCGIARLQIQQLKMKPETCNPQPRHSREKGMGEREEDEDEDKDKDVLRLVHLCLSAERILSTLI
jgi:hypothetical protein